MLIATRKMTGDLVMFRPLENDINKKLVLKIFKVSHFKAFNFPSSF